MVSRSQDRAAATAPPPPRYTPGGLGPNAQEAIRNRQLRYSTRMGAGGMPGEIEQKRLLRMGEVTAGRTTAGRQRDEGLTTADQNAAARGLGRSGIRDLNRGRVQTGYMEAMGGMQRAEDQATFDAQSERNAEDYGYRDDLTRLNTEGAGEDYANWLQANPNQGAIGDTVNTYAGVPRTAISSGVSAIPTWEKWLQLHPWANTAAKRKMLRSKYDQMSAGRR